MDPSGIFPTSYRTDRRVVRTRWQMAALALFVGLMLAAPLPRERTHRRNSEHDDDQRGHRRRLQICTGYAGQINLGQAAFMGVGALYRRDSGIENGSHIPSDVPLAVICCAVRFSLRADRGTDHGVLPSLHHHCGAVHLSHLAVLTLPSNWMGGSNGITVPPAELFGLRFVGEPAQFS
ncbi:ABC transporter permease [Pseudosulfitobacter pseudonitzschiae]|uniref:hypothetical protein n=1 Tax=Pseudosulfitobacter pseudonitzschiae TaxID=1402135 RepID=UPI001CD3BEFC|nr:hypothetical protein [Pseudosulfitobacter pseudonitzschiae]